ncbi:MAG: DUF5131 family protein, partial [Verrucomicrobiota bacterium]
LTLPARVRFVSAEPLLGPIDMGKWIPDWVIVGGESGCGARPMEADWVRSIRDEAAAEGCRFFFKQWGGLNKKQAGRELDGELHNEMPVGNFY